MRNLNLGMFLFLICCSSCTAKEAYNEKFVQSVIDGNLYPAYYDYIFMTAELIEIYHRDTNKLNFDMAIFSQIDYGKPCDNYYFYVIKSMLKERLQKDLASINQEDKALLVNKIINSIVTTPTIIRDDSFSDWNNFYNCFFEDPGDEKNFSLFTLIFMTESDLISFLDNEESLEYWNSSVIIDLQVGGGDFMDNKTSNGTDLLFERQANYIITRWDNSNNPIIQKTVSAFKDALKK